MTSTRHEIIEVRGDATTLDSRSRLSSWLRHFGRRLTPGFYLVLSSAEKSPGMRLRRSRYFGPFRDRTLAEKLLTSAAYLGIIAPREGRTTPGRAGADAGPAYWQARRLELE